jgi:hypothetical protein
MHKFSTILYILGFSFLVIGFAHESQNIISFCRKKETIHRIKRTAITIGEICKVNSRHSCQEPVSVKKIDKTTRKINNKNNGKRINNNIVFLWFSALKLCIHW